MKSAARTGSPAPLDRFEAVIVRHLGLAFDANRRAQLQDALGRRLEATRLTVDAYLARLEGAVPPTALRAELRALAPWVTVGETSFFRNLGHFDAFLEVVMPTVLRVRAATRRVNLLSAACSSGEEPYTVAMLLRERFPDLASWDVRVTGVDINIDALARARAARYSSWSLRQVPADLRARYFTIVGRELVLDPSIAGRVRFAESNLNDDDPDLWAAGTYDVVFCRNVLMYFEPSAAAAVVARIHHATAPGGYLFVGHAETLRGLSDGYAACQSHQTFYYQRVDAAPPRAVALPADWRSAIERAHERVARLAAADRAAPATAQADPRPLAATLADAYVCLDEERFSDGICALDALAPTADPRATCPEATLLRAVLLLGAGDLDAAEEALVELLARDRVDAGAHHALALLHDQRGDLERAARSDRAAVNLDPGFAMPRLHLGLLARRAGDLHTARRELGRARALLAREDAGRVRLFGGGFQRGALVALCNAELRALGREP